MSGISAQTVERIARTAIRERLGYVQDNTVIQCVQQDQEVLLHVNSGGNALAAEEALLASGYDVAAGPAADYGVRMLVRSLPAMLNVQRCPNC